VDGAESCYHVPITATETEIDSTGANAIKLGGHFQGSLTLLFDGHLLHADMMMMTPSGLGKWEVDAKGAARKKPPGQTTFSSH
jgi:glyoxylase-like metal-dependent hydrolase (beta-lactamase superfamily II)